MSAGPSLLAMLAAGAKAEHSELAVAAGAQEQVKEAANDDSRRELVCHRTVFVVVAYKKCS